MEAAENETFPAPPPADDPALPPEAAEGEGWPPPSPRSPMGRAPLGAPPVPVSPLAPKTSWLAQAASPASPTSFGKPTWSRKESFGVW